MYAGPFIQVPMNAPYENLSLIGQAVSETGGRQTMGIL